MLLTKFERAKRLPKFSVYNLNADWNDNCFQRLVGANS